MVIWEFRSLHFCVDHRCNAYCTMCNIMIIRAWWKRGAVVRFKYQPVLVPRAQNKPKYKPETQEKIISKFIDRTSITDCIEFYRLALGPYGTTALSKRCTPRHPVCPIEASENVVVVSCCPQLTIHRNAANLRLRTLLSILPVNQLSLK